MMEKRNAFCNNNDNMTASGLVTADTFLDSIIREIRNNRSDVESRIDYISECNHRMKNTIQGVIGDISDPVMDRDDRAIASKPPEPANKSEVLRMELSYLNVRLATLHALIGEYDSLLNTLSTII